MDISEKCLHLIMIKYDTKQVKRWMHGEAENVKIKESVLYNSVKIIHFP